MGKTEEYIAKEREGKSDTEEVTEQIRADDVSELAATRAELEIQKLKAEIRKLDDEAQQFQHHQIQNFANVSALFSFMTACSAPRVLCTYRQPFFCIGSL